MNAPVLSYADTSLPAHNRCDKKNAFIHHVRCIPTNKQTHEREKKTVMMKQRKHKKNGRSRVLSEHNSTKCVQCHLSGEFYAMITNFHEMPHLCALK